MGCVFRIEDYFDSKEEHRLFLLDEEKVKAFQEKYDHIIWPKTELGPSGMMMKKD